MVILGSSLGSPFGLFLVVRLALVIDVMWCSESEVYVVEDDEGSFGVKGFKYVRTWLLAMCVSSMSVFSLSFLISWPATFYILFTFA